MKKEKRGPTMRGSSSSSKPGRKPAGSFLVILMDPNFHTSVMVPTYFSRKYEVCLSREKVRLRLSTGPKMWYVNVEKKMEGETERYALTSGWDMFCHDTGLRHGEFVVFTLCGPYQRGHTFEVSVYGTHGCECLVPDGSKSFNVLLRKIHMPNMDIPKVMVDEETGIMAGEWIKLVNGEGEEWAVEVCRRAREEEKLYLNQGWRAFREANNLCLGDELQFSLVDTRPPTLLVVTVTGPAAKKAKLRKRPHKN